MFYVQNFKLFKMTLNNLRRGKNSNPIAMIVRDQKSVTTA
jgi:hypothetical protein